MQIRLRLRDTAAGATCSIQRLPNIVVSAGVRAHTCKRARQLFATCVCDSSDGNADNDGFSARLRFRDKGNQNDRARSVGLVATSLELPVKYCKNILSAKKFRANHARKSAPRLSEKHDTIVNTIEITRWRARWTRNQINARNDRWLRWIISPNYINTR